MTQDDINSDVNPFVQLVSGVVWLVRNGTNFVKHSLEIEAMYHRVQETGMYTRCFDALQWLSTSEMFCRLCV